MKAALTAKDQEISIIQEERLSLWRERQKQIACPFSHEVETVDVSVYQALADFKDKNVSEEEKIEAYKATMSAATGSASHEYANMLFCQTLSGFFITDNSDRSATTNAVFNSLLSMSPQDEYEGMLCSRLLVLHNQYMHFMARVSYKDQYPDGIDLNINRATKLMRLYNETLEALNKYRRKGEQKVTVQHVNVNNGGQAIVAGEVSQGRGTNKK